MFFFQRKKLPEDPPDIRLMKAVKFIDKDLKANRSGVLTQEQRQRIRRGQVWGAVGLWTVAIAFSFLAVFLGARLDWQTEPGIWFLGLAALAFVAAAFWQQNRTKRILVDNQVDSVSGFLSRRIDMVYTGKVFIPMHKIIVGEKSFTVGHNVYNSFVEGEQYTLYYVPGSEQILSAELVYDAEREKRLAEPEATDVHLETLDSAETETQSLFH